MRLLPFIVEKHPVEGVDAIFPGDLGVRHITCVRVNQKSTD